MGVDSKSFDLEKESLLASGLKSEQEINLYMDKLDRIYKQFLSTITLPIDLKAQAELLFRWLWSEKPTRYQPQGSFRLNEVIDAQLSSNIFSVVNCLGLTLLYNCLLRKMGVPSEALYLEDAFGRGPHVLTLIPINDSFIDVENIFPDGFDFKGHRNNPRRVRWGDRELVADIYHSVGNKLFFKGKYKEALRNYERAIELNPRYEKARLNRMILLDKIAMEGIYEKDKGM